MLRTNLHLLLFQNIMICWFIKRYGKEKEEVKAQ